MTLDETTQLYAVEKVLEEMKDCEKVLDDWNTSWEIQLSNAYCPPLHYEFGETDVRVLERKYEPRYKLSNAYYSDCSIGVPLAKETLVDDNGYTCEPESFEVEFGRIDWYNANSHNATRRFSFDNNGNIEFDKIKKRGQSLTKKHPQSVSYNASYNVLADDFDLYLTVSRLIPGIKDSYKYDDFSVSLKDNKLLEKLNDIEIICDLKTGKRLIKISKYNASVKFELALNPDDSVERGSVEINSHKGNGKVNGTYRLDASREKGIRANFYSRKGVKVDLTSNPRLLSEANRLLSIYSGDNISDIIISGFSDSCQKAIANNIKESIDNADFNMEAVNQAEKKIIDMVKGIKGEVPLTGLVERIDNYLDLVKDNKEVRAIDDKSKKLELKQ